MDTKRFLLAIGLTLLVLWLYQAWLEYQYPGYYEARQASQEQTDSPGTSPETRGPGKGEAVPEAETAPEGGSEREVPEVSGQSRPDQPEQSPATSSQAAQSGAQPGLTVTSDVLRLTFGRRTGDPMRAELLRYRQEDRKDSPPVAVLKAQGPRVVVAQSGWLAQDLPAPSHGAEFQLVRPTMPVAMRGEEPVSLEEGEDRVRVTFAHSQGDLQFRKTYEIVRGSYQVGVEYTVVNRSSADWQGHLYGQFRERGSKAGGNWFLSGFSYDGPVVFTDDAMETFSHQTLLERPNQRFQASDSTGWGGIMSRYFLTAWIPDPERANTIFSRAAGADSYSGYSAPFPTVAPGEQATVRQSLFLGPKDQAVLEGAGRHLRRSVDYGILSFLAIPLFEVLQFFHGLVGNYGIAIILVTLAIKLVFFPLFSMSYRAMAKMRKVQPELQRLREQYGDDRQKLNQEMMRLYKEEKVNPLGGCLPILVQIPVFISLYWVLLESVELRHEPFMLWITDLTSQDPFYVLPVLMGASMVVQQMLNPSPLDPVQKKVMLALPVVFTFFFIQFPAGLVLYWLSNNLISIGQQWWIMRKIG